MVTMRYPRTDIRSEIFQMLNSSFLADEMRIDERIGRITNVIFDDFMSNRRQKRKLYFLLHPNVFKQAYLQFVLEPEGLIYYLMTRDRLNRQEAEKVTAVAPW